MNRSIAIFGAVCALAFGTVTHAAEQWVAGRHYNLITPAQRTSVPAGKIEVAEIFSYGCPFCAQILPVMGRLKASLPANAQLVYIPASYIPNEDWPMFQRAFFTAQAMGIMEKTHEAMFNAVWKTGELSVSDSVTHRLKSPLPSIEDAAKFYARTAGIKEADFIATSKSFGVDAKMRGADGFILMTQALSTPTFIVNGKYRLDAQTAGNYDNVIALINYLVKQESAVASGKPAKTAR